MFPLCTYIYIYIHRYIHTHNTHMYLMKSTLENCFEYLTSPTLWHPQCAGVDSWWCWTACGRLRRGTSCNRRGARTGDSRWNVCMWYRMSNNCMGMAQELWNTIHDSLIDNQVDEIHRFLLFWCELLQGTRVLIHSHVYVPSDVTESELSWRPKASTPNVEPGFLFVDPWT